MARTTDQPSAATTHTVAPDPARGANGHGPLGDEQGRKDPVGQPVDTAGAGDRRPGSAADRDADERVSERSALAVAGAQERRIGENSESPQARGSRGRDTDGFGAPTDLTARAEQARAAAVDNTRELQDALLGVIRQGQEATVALVGMWTETGRRPGLFGDAPTRAAISSGYDLFAQLLGEQRRFVDALLDQQRHFAEALLTPPPLTGADRRWPPPGSTMAPTARDDHVHR